MSSVNDLNVEGTPLDDSPFLESGQREEAFVDKPRHWLRRSHPVWILAISVLLSILSSMCGPGNYELYFDLMCLVHPPEQVGSDGPGVQLPMTPTPYGILSAVPRSKYFVASVPPPFPGVDPVACRKDKTVQRLVAKLFMFMSVISGLVSMSTAPAWSALSDRVGRCKVISAFALGLVIEKGCILFVSVWPHLVKPWIIYIMFAGTTVFSLLGGSTAANAVSSAYMTDASSDSNYSTLFAVSTGIGTCGAVVGPLIGSHLISRTSNLLLPSEIAFAGYTFLFLMAAFVIPESLSAEARERNRLAAQESVTEVSDPDMGWVQRSTKRLVALPKRFLTVLAVLAPQGGPRRKDCNLSLLAFISFITKLSQSEGGPMAEYAMLTFGWDHTNFGPLASATNLTAVVVLLIVVPSATRLIKPLLAKSVSSEDAATIADETSPLLPVSENSVGGTLDADSAPDDNAKPDLSRRVTMAFDRGGLLVALLASTLGSVIMGINAKGSATLFLVGLLGSIFVTSGQLFGAFSLVDTLGVTFASPILYTTVYSLTLDWYPPTMFLVAAATFIVAIVGLMRVRVPRLRS